MQDFNDKTVYITGGSSGIGLSCAQLLAQHGAHIIIFARTRERLTSALTIIEGKRVSSRQRFACQALDVTNNAMVKQVMAESVKAFGAPDILINSAGRSEPGYFEDITPEHFDATMQVNMYGIWNTIAALAPDMKKMGGVIVNVSFGSKRFFSAKAVELTVRVFSGSLTIFSPFTVNAGLDIGKSFQSHEQRKR